MIKFFRKIRQKLLSKGKLSKYLFYAIGEIILVMIGILLALQVNNWNENKKATANELKLLKQLEQDLTANEKEYEQIRRAYLAFQDAGQYILNHMDKNMSITDSLLDNFRRSQSQIDFNPINTSYIFMLNSGLNELKNDSLRIALTKFYEQDIRLMNLRNDKLLAIQVQHLDPFMITHFKVEKIKFKNSIYFNSLMTVPRDYLNLVSNEDYANILVLKDKRLNLNLIRLSQSLQNLENLIEFLRNEIQSIEAD